MRSSVAPFFPRFQREGVVGAISARLHIAAMGMPLVFARAKRLASGSSFCISRHNIGSNAWMQVQSRSEEHKSELQSLMRISYAVFCLKKKKQNKKQQS